jgi:putative transposase
VVSHLAGKIPIQRLCQVLGLRRRTKYYRAPPRPEETLQAQIRTVTGTFPTYGVRRVTLQRRRDYKIKINHKRVARRMCELGRNRKKRRKKRKTTQSQHEFPRDPNLLTDLDIVRPDQVWGCDIPSIHLAHEDVYLAVIMDLYTRRIRGWHLGRSLEQALTLTALQRALKNGGPEIHPSDPGVP